MPSLREMKRLQRMLCISELAIASMSSVRAGKREEGKKQRTVEMGYIIEMVVSREQAKTIAASTFEQWAIVLIWFSFMSVIFVCERHSNRTIFLALRDSTVQIFDDKTAQISNSFCMAS